MRCNLVWAASLTRFEGSYLGRSSGHGALSLWTWNLKTISPIPSYVKSYYSGPAIKLGSGVVAGEAYEAAHDAGYRVVGGLCASVALAGGYTQGGGHSLLSTAYGMGADQVLEWEVVTADGRHLVATPEENSDLHWALGGGGGGTFAVVLSMTAKAYPDGPVAGGTLSVPNTDDIAFWDAIALWIRQAEALAGDTNTMVYEVRNDAFDAYAMTLPDQPREAVETLLAPFLANLTQLGLNYTLETTYFDNYKNHFASYYGPLPFGVVTPTTILQSRLVPKAVTQDTVATEKLVEAIKTSVEDGNFLVGCEIVSVATAGHLDNAVLPAWRQAITGCNMNAYWNFTAPIEVNYDLKRVMEEVYTPLWEAATPGGGVYLNEMDPWYKGDWKTALFGNNYERLLAIKHSVDPSHLLWGNFTVGADELALDGSGRLCEVFS